jgi:hypothetical protein
LLAIVGGVALAVSVLDWAIVDAARPGAHEWEKAGWSVWAILGAGGVVALCASLLGIGVVLAYRYDSPVSMVAFIGTGGVLALFGASGALFLLPAASVVVIVYLAKIHAVAWSLASLHVASAPGLLLAQAAYGDSSLIGISTLLVLAYCATWTLLGVELLHGLPEVHTTASSAS